MTYDKQKLIRWNELKDQKESVEDDLDVIKAELSELDAEIQLMFIDAGLDAVKMDGYTIHLNTTVWAKKSGKDIDQDAVCEALGAAGMFDLVKESYNSNQVSAWMRELADENGDIELPSELEGVLEATKVTQVRRRKS